MLNPLELNDMVTLLPHLIAAFLYFFLFLAAGWNIASSVHAKVQDESTKRLKKLGIVQIVVATYFVILQYYWMSVSVIGDDPTSMQVAWTSFHFINPVVHLYIALQRYVDRCRFTK